MKLTDEQKKAVEFIGAPTLVVSGAGSGKTTVLTNKIVSLIQKGFRSERILAITFTNKAAEEMKSRLLTLTGLPENKFPWVRTYHSACFRILKIRCGLLGYKSPLQIYDAYQQEKLLKEIVIGMNFDKKHVSLVQYHISRAKNTGNPLKYFDLRPRVYTVPLVQVFNAYEKELFARNAVDFDNILLKTRDLLRDHKNVREYYQNLFEYILCDEFQDTNPLQAVLTDMLVKKGNLFCVGDDYQAIYGFRGSDIDQFLSFPKKYKDAKIFRLEQNFRSADEIVQIADRLISHNTQRMEKKCFSEKHGGDVKFQKFSDEEQEAEWVGKKVKVLADTGISVDRMAVLYRTKFCSRVFEKAFRRLGIPYQMMGSKGFFERKEIMDINAYIKSAVFPKDDVSFERIINIPPRGIGKKAVEKIAETKAAGVSLQGATRKSLAEKLMSSKNHNALSQLIQTLDEIQNMPPEKAIRKVLSEFDYMAYLRKYVKDDAADYVSREENIKELLWSASKKETLLDYLEEVDLIHEDKSEENEDRTRGVKLSTIHASKGLEYHVVFIAGCEEDLLPHWRSKSSESEFQEERRLMYVAITRAEKYLFMSYATFRMGNSAKKSRFLDEIILE